MPLSVRPEIVTLAPTGALNVDTSPPTIAKPATLAIGDVHCVLVIYQSLTTANVTYTPSGMTSQQPAADAAQRRMQFYTRPIKTQADLTAAASTTLRAGGTASRVVAFSFAVAGANLDNPVASVGAWRVTGSGATINNYFIPAVDTGFILYGTYSNNAAATTHPRHYSPWGTRLAHAMALSGATASESDTVLSLMLGGTNTTFTTDDTGTTTMATANSGSFGVAFNAALPAGPKAKIVYNGVVTDVTYKYIVDKGVLKNIGKVTVPDPNTVITPGEGDPEPPAATQPSEGLWFNSDAIQTPLSNPNKIVTAHSFPPYPMHIGASDYYANNYFPVTASSSNEIHFAEGGFLRNGPIAPARITGYTEAQQAVSDHKYDIARATVMGIDVFVIDIISTSGNNFNYVERLIQARDEMGAGPYTMLTPMLDCNGAVVENTGYVGAAAHIAKHKGKNGTWILPDGRMPVGAFKMEDAVDTPPQFWVDLTRELKTVHGINPAYMGAMNTFSSTTVNNIKNALEAAGYTDAFYAAGPWGTGGQDPLVINGTSNFAATATGAGLKAYMPIQGQNIRPGTSTSATGVKVPAGKTGTTPHGLYDEAVGTEAFRAGWNKIHTQGADLVQYVTWNDYSEGGEVQPSLAKGWSVADLSTWEAYKFKTGAYPTILRDNVILAHRSQFAFVDGPEDVTNTKQTAFMWQWERGGTETVPQDIVEALVFLTAPATVEVKVGTATYTQNVTTAGMTSVKFPLGEGRVSARIIRNGGEVIGVVSPVKVVLKPVVDDKQYFVFSALRGVADQRDPTDNKTLTMAADTAPTPEPQPQPTNATPGSVLNIGPNDGQNHYSVQIAVVGDTTQSHSMNEITNGYQRPVEFTTSNNGTRVKFRTYVQAPILDNSSWPRAELRGRNKDGSMQAYDATVGVHWQHQRGRVLRLPTNKSEIVLSQLHNGASDRIALRIQDVGGVPRLIWRVNGVQVYIFANPYILGTEYRAMWRVENRIITLYDGNMTTPVYTSGATTLAKTSGITTFYDKLGNYVQSTDGSQPQNTQYYDDAGEYGEVELWDVRHWHTGWAPNALGDPKVTG